jgi:Uma2 family endonuclease
MVAVEPMGLGEPPRPTRMTDEEWANLPEDEEGELVDGLLVEEEVPDLAHELAVSWLVKTLSNWADPRGGFATASELKYILRAGRGRKPDVSMLLPGQEVPQDRGALRRPLDVFVEVVSPTPRDARRDRFEKFAEYAAFGARYYWIVDPAIRTFEFFVLNEQGGYAHMRAANSGKVENIPGCEGLVLDLDELWSRIEKFAGGEPKKSNAETD